VNTALREWTPPEGLPRRAGVSSFGMGGTNAHVILEEAPQFPSRPSSRPYQLLQLSARTAQALESATANLAAHLREHPEDEIADLAYTLQVGRKAFEHRRILSARGARTFCVRWRRATNNAAGRRAGIARASVAMLFPDAGEHYAGMAREIYEHEPAFRAIIDRGCALLRPILGRDLRGALLSAGATDGAPMSDLLRRPDLAQPAVFLIEYALAQLLQSWGIIPDAVLGQGSGEYAAACVAGVLSFEDALTLVARHAQLSQTTTPVPEAELLRLFEAVTLATPRIRLLSGTTGRWISDDEATDPAFWHATWASRHASATPWRNYSRIASACSWRSAPANRSARSHGSIRSTRRSNRTRSCRRCLAPPTPSPTSPSSWARWANSGSRASRCIGPATIRAKAASAYPCPPTPSSGSATGPTRRAAVRRGSPAQRGRQAAQPRRLVLYGGLGAGAAPAAESAPEKSG